MGDARDNSSGADGFRGLRLRQVREGEDAFDWRGEDVDAAVVPGQVFGARVWARWRFSGNVSGDLVRGDQVV